MARPIHPAAKATAAKFGCEIVESTGGFRLLQTESGILSVDEFDRVAEATEELRRSGIEGIEWEKPRASNSHARSGVMVIGYHRVYSSNPHGPGNGDTLDVSLRDATQALGADGKPTGAMDSAMLRQIGVDAGLWRDTWEGLNPGMRRMNLANRMRGWLRNNAGVLRIGDQEGRFGVELRTKEAKAD